MKKIITALTVTALAFSAAFADVALEFTQNAYILADKAVGANNTGTLDLFTGYKGYDTPQTGQTITDKSSVGKDGITEGNLKFTAKTKVAGVEFTVKPTLNNSGNTIAWSTYYGWAKFFEGAMELRAGRWESRTVNRYTSYQGKIPGTFYERYKPGIGVNKAIGADINNLTGKAKAAQLKYSMDGGVWVTGALIKSAYDAASGINSQSGWAAEFGTPIGEGSKLIIDFKNLKQDQYSLAAFFENTTLKEGLDFQAGFIFDRTDATTNNMMWAGDFRASYELADNVTLITMNNLTYDGTTSVGGVYRLWDMASLAIMASDAATLNLTVHWEHDDLLNTYENEDNAIGQIDFSPMIKYQVGKGVDITGGVHIAVLGWSKPNTTLFSIPFVLHVSM